MSTDEATPLIAIGYWRVPIRDIAHGNWDIIGYEPEWLADPKRLCEVLGTSAVDAKVVRYLQRGQKYEVWRGWSWCRFDCDAPDKELGHADLTDGVWIWPQGLAHYVKRHGVPLPEEFLATVRRARAPVEIAKGSAREIDRDFWNTWYAQRCLSRCPPDSTS